MMCGFISITECIIASMSFSIMGAAGTLPLIPLARTLRLLNVYVDRLNSIICHPPVASGHVCSSPPVSLPSKLSSYVPMLPNAPAEINPYGPFPSD